MKQAFYYSILILIGLNISAMALEKPDNTKTLAQTQPTPQIQLAPEIQNAAISQENTQNTATLDLDQNKKNKPETSTSSEKTAVQNTKSSTFSNSLKRINTQASLPKSMEQKQFLSLNFESIIMRGDINIGYTSQVDPEWTTVIRAHVNPHPIHSNQTGIAGILGGGRFYLGSQSLKTPYFQLIGGFNYEANKSWAPVIELTGGYSFEWRKKTSIDFGITANRSYVEQKSDPNLNIFIDITREVNLKKLSFL